MTSDMERRLLCENVDSRIKEQYSNVFEALNKGVEYISFRICENENWFRIFLKSSNGLENYLIFGYDLIPLCNMVGIEFDIDKIMNGYEFKRVICYE